MPVALGGTPALSCHIQISFTPPFTTPSWVDITRYVRSFQTTLGRQHELQRIVPSTLTLTLRNSDARFNTWNTAGPYAGMGVGLVPQMPIRVLATWDTVPYSVFYGYVDTWMPVLPDPLSSDLTISATDILGMLGVDDLTSTLYAETVVADGAVAYYRMDDMGAPTCHDSAAGHHDGTFNGDEAFGQAGALLGDTNAAVDLQGTGYVYLPTSLAPTASNPFTWECWVQLDGPVPGGGFPLLVANVVGNLQQTGLVLNPGSVQFFSVDSGGTTYFDGADGVVNNDGGWHHICVTFDGSQIVVYVDGVVPGPWPVSAHVGLATPSQFLIGAFPGSVLIPCNGKVDEVAIYNHALSAAQVVNHYQLGGFAYPVELSGLRFQKVAKVAGVPPELTFLPYNGDTVVQGATSALVGTKVADYLQTLADTEQGILVQAPNGILSFFPRHYVLIAPTSNTSQATFEDAPSSDYFYQIDGFAPGLDNLDLWNEVTASAQQGPSTTGAVQVYRDPASIARYGKRSYPSLSGLLVTTDQEALSLAQWVGTHYKYSVPRIREITMDSVINEGGDLPQMLGRRILDRVTVIYHGQVGGTPLVQESIIEGIDHDVSAVGVWKTTWHLSPAETQTYLILNDTTLGVIDSTNLLAY